MAQQEAVLKSVERLNYRVTVGDVAASAGLNIQEAQQGVLALASEVQAHLQVSETGEIAYEFPRNMRAVLLSKYWRLRLKAAWERVWKVLFYLIRISFGIFLILSLVLITIAIIALVVAASAARQGEDRDNDGGMGGMVFLPRIWFGPNFFYLFDYDYDRRHRPVHREGRGSRQDSGLNFFEAVFSFLFGDGDPNADLEERRWQSIAAIIRKHNGAVIAEQIAPYLDELGQGWSREYEDYMLPVLSRFNGQPEVSEEGQIIYRFPELQVTAESRRARSIPPFLQELPRRFSQASSGQILGAIALGSANWIGALVLGNLLQDQLLVAQLGGLVAFVNSIYWLLLAYGTAFLVVPLVRYFWVQWRNRKMAERNTRREAHAEVLLHPDETVRHKLTFARQFAAQTIVSEDNLAYTTEKDLIEQEAENRDKLDEEWRKMLEQRNQP